MPPEHFVLGTGAGIQPRHRQLPLSGDRSTQMRKHSHRLETIMMTTRSLEDLTMQQLFLRVRGEFMEMPGLQVNVRQAQRLWGLESTCCEAILNTLVDTGFLTPTRGEAFALRRNRP